MTHEQELFAQQLIQRLYAKNIFINPDAVYKAVDNLYV